MIKHGVGFGSFPVLVPRFRTFKTGSEPSKPVSIPVLKVRFWFRSGFGSSDGSGYRLSPLPDNTLVVVWPAFCSCCRNLRRYSYRVDRVSLLSISSWIPPVLNVSVPQSSCPPSSPSSTVPFQVLSPCEDPAPILQAAPHQLTLQPVITATEPATSTSLSITDQSRLPVPSSYVASPVAESSSPVAAVVPFGLAPTQQPFTSASGFFDPYTMVVYHGGMFVYADDNIVGYT
ncbi:hypothetical protein LWI28_014074 [Acer negundo]|uniref:Uncharacterized protein n=1 Tax=Acer negundo TaxID=4023 RepID=A0AAD5JD35_ACENE|nr:hypothetical protein LWI28_014074 [Acer negundo]